jgi:hypothetical protein
MKEYLSDRDSEFRESRGTNPQNFNFLILCFISGATLMLPSCPAVCV